MDPVEIDSVATPKLTDPILIEGLPGVGLVGKLAVDHLLEQTDSDPVRHIYSEYFPPGVSVDEDGVASLASITVSSVQLANTDLLILGGDTQAQDAQGQYRLADTVLDIAASFNVQEIITLGGFATGQQVSEYSVIGAISSGSEDLKERLIDVGVEFNRGDAPGNIIGMSGLLIGLGERRDFSAAGLLGITSGYHVDPASARVILEVLQDVYDFSVDLDTLEEQAEEIQKLLDQIQEYQQEPAPSQGGEDLRYFG